MSTYFLPRDKIPFDRLKTWRMAAPSEQNGDDSQALSDGKNFLWANRSATDGKSATFARYGMNDPDAIIEALEHDFGTELVSEYDDYWTELIKQYRKDYATIHLG